MVSFKGLMMTITLSITLIGCNQFQQTQALEGNTGIEENEMKLYLNDIEEYSIELPPSWFEVKVVEGNKGGVEFFYPSDVEQLLFGIFVIAETEWEELKDEPTGRQKEITREAGKVYLMNQPLDQGLTGEELAGYNDMVKEIPAIIESFAVRAVK